MAQGLHGRDFGPSEPCAVCISPPCSDERAREGASIVAAKTRFRLSFADIIQELPPPTPASECPAAEEAEVSKEISLALAELRDPATDSSRLMEIAAAFPVLSAEISRHPNVYPELLDWISQYATTDRITAATVEVYDPETPATRLMELAAEHPQLSAEIADHPNAYAELREWLGTYAATAPSVDGAGTVAALPTLLAAQAEPDAPSRENIPTLEAEAEVEAAPALARAESGGTVLEEFDLTDALISGAAAAVGLFDNFAMLDHVADESRKVRSTLTRLLGPGDEIQIAIPVVVAAETRHDAIALFTRDRVIVAWGGILSAKGEIIIPFSTVQAARIGAGPNELADRATLYIQAASQTILAMPTEDAAEVELLTQVARGIPLDDLLDNEPVPPVPPVPIELSAPTELSVPSETPVLTRVQAVEQNPLLVELEDSTVAPSRLSALARMHPELHVAIAEHPATYPDLLDWLDSRPDPATKRAVAARRRRDGETESPPPTSLVRTSTSASAPLGAGTSGWESADKALDVAERVGDVVVNVAAVIYGIFLVIVGIAIAGLGFSQNSAGAGFVGVGIAVYGIYLALPLPGYKLVIW